MSPLSAFNLAAAATLAVFASTASAAPSPRATGTTFVTETGVYTLHNPDVANYTELVPATLLYTVGTDGCDAYEPRNVDWAQVRQDVIDYLSQPGGELGPDQVPYKRVAAMMIRGSFHDAGAFTNGVGGADGSALLSQEEQHWEANGAPLKFWPYVRAAYLPIVEKHFISWADMIAVGGAAATQFLGLTSPFDLKVGRCDNPKANVEGILPAANLSYTEFVHYFNSIGLNIKEAAALMGAHVTLEDGQGHSDGVQQYTWSNKFFRDSVTGTITVNGTEMQDQSVQWSAGNWQYTVNDAFIAPANVPSRCPFSRLYKDLISVYAGDEAAWIADYNDAFARLTEVGATWSPAATSVSIGA